MYFSAANERDKGTRFERFLKSYLQTEPKYADLFSEVWMWSEWPGREARPDTGIDLVARDRYTGELTAIQAKFFDPERSLPKQEIDSFFTELGKEPFASGMIVTTARNWSKHAEAALNGQTKPVQRVDLNDLAESRIDWSLFDPARPEILFKGVGKAGAWNKTRIHNNTSIDIQGIPEVAQRFTLGSRSGLSSATRSRPTRPPGSWVTRTAGLEITANPATSSTPSAAS